MSMKERISIKGSLSDGAKQAFDELDGSLQKEHLPSGLDLGVTSSQGISIGSLSIMMTSLISGME